MTTRDQNQLNERTHTHTFLNSLTGILRSKKVAGEADVSRIRLASGCSRFWEVGSGTTRGSQVAAPYTSIGQLETRSERAREL